MMLFFPHLVSSTLHYYIGKNLAEKKLCSAPDWIQYPISMMAECQTLNSDKGKGDILQKF